MTRIKIFLMNTVIVLGVAVIVWVQWPEAMKNHAIGAGYDEGVGAAIYLAVLMTGIPALLYAVAVHVTLSHWLFATDELKLYRARRLVETIRPTEGTAKNTTGSMESGKHDFID